MIKLKALAAAAMAAGCVMLAAPLAHAGQPDLVVAACLPGWYVNPDEIDRKPTPVDGGLEFSGADLIHHAADLPLEDLKPGSFVASVAPDQPSFFSVEVRNGPDGAYGTLRWDLTTEKWVIVIGPGTGPALAVTDGTFTDENPVALLTGKVTKWGAFDPATARVVSFGVGYTKNPPGTVTTVVTSVTFDETPYPLGCQTQPTETATASPSTTTTVSPSPLPTPPSTPPATVPPASATPSDGVIQYPDCDAVDAALGRPINQLEPGFGPHLDSDGDGVGCEDLGNGVISGPGGNLPRTGVAYPLVAGGGIGLFLVGAGLLWYTRQRNRVEFVA